MKRRFSPVLTILITGLVLLSSCSSPSPKNLTSTKTTSGKVKQVFKLKVNSNSVWIDGKEELMDSPVREISGRTMIPIKFLLDFFKAENVSYNPATEEVSFDLYIPTDKAPKTNPASQTKKEKLLTKELEDKIKRIASLYTTYYRINNLESDSSSVSIWIDLMMEPKTTDDVKNYTETLATDVSFLFDDKQDVKVVAIRTDPGSSSFRTFGYSQYSQKTGMTFVKIENK